MEGKLEKRKKTFGFASWQARYCRLGAQTLSYTKKKDDATQPTEIKLTGLVKVETDERDPLAFSFQVPDREYRMRAPNPELREVWVRLIESFLERPPQLSGVYKSSINACASHLRRFALETTNLFNRRGIASRVAKLKAKILTSATMSSKVGLEASFSPHDVSDVLLSLLRAVPGGIFTPELQKEILKARERGKLRRAVKRLPKYNHSSLKAISNLIGELSRSRRAKATMKNLCEPLAAAAQLPYHRREEVQSIVQILLKDHEFVFRKPKKGVFGADRQLSPRPEDAAADKDGAYPPVTREDTEGVQTTIDDENDDAFLQRKARQREERLRKQREEEDKRLRAAEEQIRKRRAEEQLKKDQEEQAARRKEERERKVEEDKANRDELKEEFGLESMASMEFSSMGGDLDLDLSDEDRTPKQRAQNREDQSNKGTPEPSPGATPQQARRKDQPSREDDASNPPSASSRRSPAMPTVLETEASPVPARPPSVPTARKTGRKGKTGDGQPSVFHFPGGDSFGGDTDGDAEATAAAAAAMRSGAPTPDAKASPKKSSLPRKTVNLVRGAGAERQKTADEENGEDDDDDFALSLSVGDGSLMLPASQAERQDGAPAGVVPAPVRQTTATPTAAAAAAAAVATTQESKSDAANPVATGNEEGGNEPAVVENNGLVEDGGADLDSDVSMTELDLSEDGSEPDIDDNEDPDVIEEENAADVADGPPTPSDAAADPTASEPKNKASSEQKGQISPKPASVAQQQDTPQRSPEPKPSPAASASPRPTSPPSREWANKFAETIARSRMLEGRVARLTAQQTKDQAEIETQKLAASRAARERDAAVAAAAAARDRSKTLLDQLRESHAKAIAEKDQAFEAFRKQAEASRAEAEAAERADRERAVAALQKQYEAASRGNRDELVEQIRKELAEAQARNDAMRKEQSGLQSAVARAENSERTWRSKAERAAQELESLRKASQSNQVGMRGTVESLESQLVKFKQDEDDLRRRLAREQESVNDLSVKLAQQQAAARQAQELLAKEKKRSKSVEEALNVRLRERDEEASDLRRAQRSLLPSHSALKIDHEETKRRLAEEQERADALAAKLAARENAARDAGNDRVMQGLSMSTELEKMKLQLAAAEQARDAARQELDVSKRVLAERKGGDATMTALSVATASRPTTSAGPPPTGDTTLALDVSLASFQTAGDGVPATPSQRLSRSRLSETRIRLRRIADGAAEGLARSQARLAKLRQRMAALG